MPGAARRTVTARTVGVMKAESTGRPAGPDPRERYRSLDAPVAPDQLRATLDVSPVPDTKDDELREAEWLLRTVGAG